jgi:ankyrin repeat protein
MFAAMFGQESIVNLLLKHNADTTIQDATGNTARSYAMSKGFTRVAEMVS